jgi:hypothetical protein
VNSGVAPDGERNVALSPTIELLLDEVDVALSSGRWTFLVGRGVLPRAYAGAALRHCSVLLKEMDEARRAEREVTVRVLLRALVEAWFVGMYLALGREEALDSLAADYLATMQRWDRSLRDYNEKTQRAQARAKMSNAKIRRNNERKASWNELHPDEPPLPLTPRVSVPARGPVEFDLTPALLGAETDVLPRKLGLSEAARRVDQLLDRAGDELTVEAAYEVVYRALSTWATHTTLPLLDGYFPRVKGRHYLRVAPTAAGPPVAEGLTKNAMLLTAILARRVLAMNGTVATIATAIERVAREPALREGQSSRVIETPGD